MGGIGRAGWLAVIESQLLGMPTPLRPWIPVLEILTQVPGGILLKMLSLVLFRALGSIWEAQHPSLRVGG